MSSTLMTITVPQGVKPGQCIQVQTPAGQTVQATVPAGISEGQTFQISVGTPQAVAGAVAMVQLQQPAAAGAGIGAFGPMPNIFVSQTRKGCLQEIFGCDANTEFIFGTRNNQPKAGPMGMNGPEGKPQNTMFYAVENASWLCRQCFSTQRSSKLDMYVGNDETGAKVMSYDRPFRSMLQPCKCFCFQQMDFFDEKAQPIGKVMEPFYCCVPFFNVMDEKEQVQYRVQMPTCCGGLCVDCCAEGCCNMKIPFYIYGAEGDMTRTNELLGKTPKTDPKGSRNGFMISQITKVWAGFAKEMYSDADNFDVEFPSDSTPKQKALLVGTVFFLNMLFFERQKNKQ